MTQRKNAVRQVTFERLAPSTDSGHTGPTGPADPREAKAGDALPEVGLGLNQCCSQITPASSVNPSRRRHSFPLVSLHILEGTIKCVAFRVWRVGLGMFPCPVCPVLFHLLSNICIKPLDHKITRKQHSAKSAQR